MPEFLVSCNIINGNDSGSQSGIGTALGQVAIAGSSTPAGVDAFPPVSGSTLGQVGYHSIAVGATDMDGDDANRQPAAMRRALTQLTLKGSAGVVISRNNAPVTAKNCAAVFAGASARYWVDPSDVGLMPGQIPPTPATLMLAQLEGHPSVFVRRNQNVRGLISQQPSTIPAQPLVAIAQAVVAACPVEVFVVNRPPTFSTWVLSIDGVAVVVTVPHPVGTNFKRPLEAWNEVLSPLIANNNRNDLAITVMQVATAGLVNVFTERGLLSRLNYTCYARFVAPLDASTAAMTTALYPP